MSLAPTLHLPYCRSGSDAFYSLPPEALSDLDAISAPVEYRNGTTLMRQGDPPRFVGSSTKRLQKRMGRAL